MLLNVTADHLYIQVRGAGIVGNALPLISRKLDWIARIRDNT
jgi:hypothetical protein